PARRKFCSRRTATITAPQSGRKGEFSAKSSAWEENKGFLEGKLLEVRLDLGRWFIVKRAARMESAKPAAEPSAIAGTVTALRARSAVSNTSP
ncbi:MAG TPA: hypothetical protein VK251_11205, partial [Steroidobacteraceae bacterium]|nr:hypothetical protein [Steroidobacteraceae bacterium]